MELICSNCHKAIDTNNINIATDLAKCGNCGAIHKASALVPSSDDKKLASPPAGSKIQMTKEMDGSIKIFLPKKGFTTSDIPLVFFAIFWLGFISFWTIMAVRGSILFAMFSLPFWFIGIAMLISVINSIKETQAVIVTRNSVIIEKNKPVNGKRYEFTYPVIHAIKMNQYKPGPFSAFSNPRFMFRNSWSFGAGIHLPAIISGSGTFYFFESANDAEQEWVTAFLDGKVKHGKR